jgi:hypothetical protein
MLKKSILLFTTLLIGCIPLFSQTLISSELIGSQTKDNLIAQYGLNIFDYDVDFYKIEYTSLDITGLLDTVSGLLVVPDASDKVFPLLCYQHGTVGSKENVPSNLSGGYEIAEVWGSAGYTVFAPDYLGLGEGRGFHPYVHQASEASAAIDMMEASKTFLNDNEFHFNDQLFITGYSQGGHAAAALHKELEENYNNTITVTASAPMSGPYSISGVMQDFMYSEIPYNFVSYLPYTLLSYQTAYGNIFTDVEDVFRPAYAPFVEDFYSGDIDLGDLNQIFIDMLTQEFGASIPIKMLQDSVVNNVFTNYNHPINIAMRDNDVHNWAPQAPTRLYYCEGDDQVPFMNSVVASDTMNFLGANDLNAINVNSDFDHGECVQPAIFNAYIFFGTFQQIDDIVDVNGHYLASKFTIFPNPTRDVFFIKNEKGDGRVQLLNLDGKILLEKNLTLGFNEFSTADLEHGFYFLKIKIGDSFFVEKMVVQD